MTRFIFLLSLVLFTGITADYGQSIFGPNYNAVLRNGNLDYKNGKYDDALLKYNTVLNKKQNDPLVNYNLGTILYKKGDFDTAAYFFNNALKYVKDPNLKSKAYYNLGNAYMKDKKYDKAIESYSNALKYNPGDEDSRYNLSYALRNQKQQQQQQQQQNSNPPPQTEKKEEKIDQNQANELIKSLNNKEQEQNKKIKGQGNNVNAKDW